MITCNTCKQTKPVIDYRRYYTKHCRSYMKICRPCHNAKILANKIRRESSIDSKQCPKCHVVKPLLDFPPKKHKPGQRYSYCRPCNNKPYPPDKNKHNTVVDQENNFSEAFVQLAQSRSWS